jgi:hypothetical protein
MVVLLVLVLVQLPELLLGSSCWWIDLVGRVELVSLGWQERQALVLVLVLVLSVQQLVLVLVSPLVLVQVQLLLVLVLVQVLVLVLVSLLVLVSPLVLMWHLQQHWPPRQRCTVFR